ncbi:MAG: helix-turn-helix domain-containing protein [Candidatus Nanoarchaeia archaeon]|nr:helix-turn-helix domain-containing protein [Candidatus Nanoarchaeia archaeon]MDD5053753.1 helix-turn-helix domain-containing protein [Candidatus Nanoarchaeia archaeon]MDD5499824.1 helix-turn-helix domain-containing protein [Candidatus Nanoarchaeia archaeon]
MDEDFVEDIKSKFELNQYEVKIWLSLLAKGVSSAGEISAESNVPRSRAYDVMESLEKKGFILLKMSKPIKYLAVKPEDIIENLKKKAEENSKNQMIKLEEFKKSESFNELSQLYKKGIKMVEPADLSGVVKGKNNIYNHMNNMIKDSGTSIVFSASLNDMNNLSQFKTELIKAQKRGVEVKMLAPKTDLKFLNADIEGIKNFESDFSRFLIIDSSNILFFLTNDSEIHPKHDVGLWVKSAPFAKNMNAMFNHMWEKLN